MNDREIFRLTNAMIYRCQPRLIANFIKIVGYQPNIAAPRKFQEKMLWRKFFDWNPLFRICCDKLKAKEFVRNKCPDLPAPKSLWVGTDLNEMPAELQSLPLAIKANHGCDMVYFHNGQGPLGTKVVEWINSWPGKVYGSELHEQAYLAANRGILVEEMLAPPSEHNLMDFQVHCFGGEPGFIEICLDPKGEHRRKSYFHPNGDPWPEIGCVNATEEDRLPDHFKYPEGTQTALQYARQISADTDYLRVDFYFLDGNWYTGELTVYPGSGFAPQKDFLTYNEESSKRWNLKNSWFYKDTPKDPIDDYHAAFKRFVNSNDGVL